MMTSYVWQCFSVSALIAWKKYRCSVYYISALSCHTAPVGQNSVESKTKSIRPRLRPRPTAVSDPKTAHVSTDGRCAQRRKNNNWDRPTMNAVNAAVFWTTTQHAALTEWRVQLSLLTATNSCLSTWCLEITLCQCYFLKHDTTPAHTAPTIADILND